MPMPTIASLRASSRARPVLTDAAIPERADVVVIGGGIAGLATARALRRHGLSVAVCEKGLIAAEQSSRAFGWICSTGLHPDKIPLAERSKTLWSTFAAEAGADRIGYRVCGLLHLCPTAGDLAAEQDWLDRAGELVPGARLLASSELAQLRVAGAGQLAGALFQPGDARVEPVLAAPALAEVARAEGVSLHETCAVRGLLHENGALAGVATERGPIACRQVVVAGGVWSRLFCGAQGIDVPQLPVHSSLMRTEGMDDAPDTCTATAEYGFRRDTLGGFVIGTTGGHRALVTRDSFALFFRFLPMLRDQWRHMKISLGTALLRDLLRPRRWRPDRPSPFEAERVLNPRPDVTVNLHTLRRLARTYPSLAAARVTEHWAGIIDATPDSLPVISETPVPGLFIHTGYSAYGLTMGLAGGEMLADLMTGREPTVDPTPFRLDRFAPGRKILPRL